MLPFWFVCDDYIVSRETMRIFSVIFQKSAVHREASMPFNVSVARLTSPFGIARAFYQLKSHVFLLSFLLYFPILAYITPSQAPLLLIFVVYTLPLHLRKSARPNAISNSNLTIKRTKQKPYSSL